MLISVILCTYNPNEAYLARTLEAVLSQDLPPAEWEFVIIDNNSSLPVSERACVRERKVRVESEVRQGLSAARECGARSTRGEILVFVDDDNLLAPDYLRQVKSIFDTPNIGVVSGEVVPEYEKEPDGWFWEFESMLAIRRPQSSRAYLTSIPLYNEFFPIGAGMAVRRRILEDYYQSIANGSPYISGRKGTQLSSSEDLDLDFFAISRGYLIGTVATLKLKHLIPSSRITIDYISRLAIASEKSTVEVNRKWMDTFRADVFGSCTTNRQNVWFRLLASCLFSWMPKYRIRYHVFRTRLEALDK
jgi:glycosyltransferase involved in cell wall biosynthesis